jgi:hypothetical protein
MRQQQEQAGFGWGGPTVCVSRRPPESHAREQEAVSIVPERKIAPTGRSAARIVVPLACGRLRRWSRSAGCC